MRRKRSKNSKQLQHLFEYGITRFALIWIWLAPLPMIYTFARGLGRFAFNILRVRRNVVLDNIQKAFPEKSPEECLLIAQRAYESFAKNVMDYMRVPVTSPDEYRSRSRIKGLCHINAALAKGKGVIVVGGHYGDFEIGAMLLPMLGYTTNFLVGNQRNKKIDKMINTNRNVSGSQIIHMGVAARGVIKALRRNELTVFLSDQDAREQGTFVNFFGRPTSTPQGAGVFALKTGAAVVFFLARQLSQGRFHVEYIPVEPEHLSGSKEDQIQQWTQAYTTILEHEIRKDPTQYFWMHRRWKTSPPATE